MATFGLLVDNKIRWNNDEEMLCKIKYSHIYTAIKLVGF
jgi:hypothetical protein